MPETTRLSQADDEHGVERWWSAVLAGTGIGSVAALCPYKQTVQFAGVLPPVVRGFVTFLKPSGKHDVLEPFTGIPSVLGIANLKEGRASVLRPTSTTSQSRQE